MQMIGSVHICIIIWDSPVTKATRVWAGDVGLN